MSLWFPWSVSVGAVQAHSTNSAFRADGHTPRSQVSMDSDTCGSNRQTLTVLLEAVLVAEERPGNSQPCNAISFSSLTLPRRHEEG
jgi:hypothetical protein